MVIVGSQGSRRGRNRRAAGHILGLVRKLVARKFDGSKARQGPGRRGSGAWWRTDCPHGERESGLGLRSNRRGLSNPDM